MPSVINIGNVNINSPQQNSSVFFGETISTGFDAHQKFNSGNGGIYGVNSLSSGNIQINNDNMDFIDGVIFDQDFKGNFGGTL